ncbi:hypothetical protein [Halorussus salinus]|uniref:hypothetical protein n=1 Tax=Halorussus salinus TaxID=1364935 RepID=UPI0010932ABE|nr:hypothetical protein [Halorussus salinus]
MSHVRNRRPATALQRHSEADLTPQTQGPVNFALGKEALLALYTTLRSEQHSVVDYLFREAKRRNAGVFTTSHVLAEVVGTVKSKRDADAAVRFWNVVVDSKIVVLHGARPWGRTDAGLGEKAIGTGVKNLYRQWTTVDFKFHEGTLVMDAVKLNEERAAEETFVVSLDGSLTNLAWNENLNILPSRTPHRSDAR